MEKKYPEKTAEQRASVQGLSHSQKSTQILLVSNAVLPWQLQTQKL